MIIAIIKTIKKAGVMEIIAIMKAIKKAGIMDNYSNYVVNHNRNHKC